MRQINDLFSPKLATAMLQPNPNIFHEVAKTVSNLGALADNQEQKEQKRESIKHNMFEANENMKLKKIGIYDGLVDSSLDRAIKKKKEKRASTDFGLRQTTIKNKISDASKLAKLLNSGQSYEEFIKENGTFISPVTTKSAMDFSNNKKTIMDKSAYKKQLSFLETDPRFMNNGAFDTQKATDFITKKIRRGEIDQSLGVQVVDGLHKATNYGIYAKPKKEQTYTPTEASKAYRENLKSISDPIERQKYRKANPFIQFRDKYNEAKKMSSGVSSTNLINTSISDFQKKYKIDNFSNYDFSNAIEKGNIPRFEVEALKRVMTNSKQAQILDSQMSKKVGALGEIAGQAKNFANYINSNDVDTNFFKAKVDAIKTYIPGLNYSKGEVENEEFRRDFLNVTATLLKLQSGLTVSDKEVARFEQSMGTLSKNKTTNFIGVKKKLEDTRNSFKGIKDIDPQYFNLKYGTRMRGLDKSLDVINKAINKNKATNHESNLPNDIEIL